MKFYRNQQIEELAEIRLAQLEEALGAPLAPPIPIDLLAEKILGLDLLWEPIDELPGETVRGALLPKKRLIILNEKYLPLFQEKPGLERSTKGHEMGHWDLFIDKETLNYPTFINLDDLSPFLKRHSAIGEVVTINRLLSSPEGQDMLREITSRADDPDEQRAVNRYAAAISMPRHLLRQEALKVDRTQWFNLYELAEKFDVTITAMRVRLEQLNLLYVKKQGAKTVLYESVEDAMGQRTFGW